MSGELDSGDGEAPRPRVSLFGRASKSAPGGGAPPGRPQPPRKPRGTGISSVSGLLTFVLLGALATVGALAWLLKRSPVMLPIPGTGKVAHLEENVGASSIKLSDDEFATLDRAGRGG